MKKTRTTIITYILLAIAIAIALFYFFRAKKFKKRFVETQEKVEEANDKAASYMQLLTIDSLVLDGQYTQALEAYKERLNGANDSSTVQLRIDLIKKIIDLQRRIFYAQDTLQDTLTIDTIPMQRYVTPEEIRQYDSLNFALAKANLQLKNLRQQLKQKAGGEYLTFSTTKGNKVHYVGEVKNGKANGRGVALLNTGSRYEGEWRNNLRHGEGIFYWPDGEYYQGEYKNDQRHGQGTYYWPNGEKFIGEWEDDERNGNGTFYGEEGEIVASGTWKEDELVEVDKK